MSRVMCKAGLLTRLGPTRKWPCLEKSTASLRVSQNFIRQRTTGNLRLQKADAPNVTQSSKLCGLDIRPIVYNLSNKICVIFILSSSEAFIFLNCATSFVINPAILLYFV